jgi:hypothetical protein
MPSSVPRAAPAAPGEAGRATLEAECSALVRHLASLEPSPRVLAAYVRAHAPGRHGPVLSTDDEDDALVRFARRGPAAARLADTFAVAFDRRGPLRRKILLATAILENDPDGECLDRPRSFGAGPLVGRLVGGGLAFGAWLIASILVVGPVWLLFLRPRRDDEEEEGAS